MGTPRRRWGQHSPSWEHGGTSRQNDKAQPFWGDSPASRDLSQTHSGCADVSYSTMTINRRWSYKTDTQPLEYCVTTERVELTTQGIIWDTCWKLNQDEGRAGRQSMCPGDCYLCFKKSEEKKKKKSEIHTPQVPHNLQREEKKLNTWLPLGPITGLKSRAEDRLHNTPFASQTLNHVNTLRVLQLVISSNPSDVTDLGNNPHCCWTHTAPGWWGPEQQQLGCPPRSSPLTSHCRGDAPAAAQLHLCATLSNENLILTILHPDLTPQLTGNFKYKGKHVKKTAS